MGKGAIVQRTKRFNPNPNTDVQRALERELRRLAGELGYRGGLKVIWAPDADSDMHGEVRDGAVFIYDEEPEDALRTLRHEFLDFYITDEVIKPLIKYINLQKTLIEYLVYERKERLVEALERALSPVP